MERQIIVVVGEMFICNKLQIDVFGILCGTVVAKEKVKDCLCETRSVDYSAPV